MESFLELLLRHAPVEAIAEAVDAAPAVERALLEEQAPLAIRLHLMIDRLRRSEQELNALSETAREIASVHEVHTLLQTIAVRTRHLLGADLSWIVIDGETDATCARVVEGAVTAGFAAHPVCRDTWFWQELMTTGVAQAVTSLDAFARSGSDTERQEAAVARTEGLVSFLGVPLACGGRRIGALFAGQRYERFFSQHEISLATSFAAHAAIAVENARLLETAQAAVDELTAAQGCLHEHAVALERSAQLDDRLIKLALQESAADVGTIDTMPVAVVDLIGGTLVILDNKRAVRAGAGALVADAAAGIAPYVHEIPIVVEGDPVGSMLFAKAEPITRDEIAALERVAVVAALALIGERSTARAELQVRGELVTDVVMSTPTSAVATERRARILGFDLAAPHVVLVALRPEARRFERVQPLLQNSPGWLASTSLGRLVVLVPGDDADAAREDGYRWLRQQVGANVLAAARPAVGAVELARAYHEADATVSIVVGLGYEDVAVTVDQLGIFALLLSERGNEHADALTNQALGRLLEYDHAHATQLTATLDAYFAAGGNVTQAAQALPVHVNTYYQRLDRITEVIGEGWKERDRALHLNLALRLQRLRANLNASNGRVVKGR